MIWLITILLIVALAGCTAITVLGTHNSVGVQKGKDIEDKSIAPQGSNKTEKKDDRPIESEDD